MWKSFRSFGLLSARNPLPSYVRVTRYKTNIHCSVFPFSFPTNLLGNALIVKHFMATFYIFPNMLVLYWNLKEHQWARRNVQIQGEISMSLVSLEFHQYLMAFWDESTFPFPSPLYKTSCPRVTRSFACWSASKDLVAFCPCYLMPLALRVGLWTSLCVSLRLSAAWCMCHIYSRNKW